MQLWSHAVSWLASGGAVQSAVESMKRRQWEEALAHLNGVEGSEALGLQGRCLYHLGRDREALQCFRRRADMGAQDDRFSLDETCAMLWSGEIGAAWRILKDGPTSLGPEVVVARIALGLAVARDEMGRFSEKMLGRMCTLSVRLAQLGQVGRALRIASAVWEVVKTEDSVYACVFPRVVRASRQDCEDVVRLITTQQGELSSRVRFCLAKALLGTGLCEQALDVVRLCVADPSNSTARSLSLQGEILASLGRHLESAESFERCVPLTPETVAQAIVQRILAGDVLGSHGLFVDRFCVFVPSSFSVTGSEEQYALNSGLRRVMQCFEEFFAPLVTSLVLSESQSSSALSVCKIWVRIVKHIKCDMDGDNTLALSFVLLHGDESDWQLARDFLQEEVRRVRAMRRETYSEYMRRLYREKRNLGGEVLVEARSMHEICLFNLLSWLELLQGNERDCAFARAIVMSAAQVLNLNPKPNYGADDAGLDDTHQLLHALK